MKTKIIVGIIVIAVLGLGGYLSLGHKKPAYQFVAVKRGSIAETVSVMGNTAPISSVSLGFGNSGTVARVYSAIGKTVSMGQTLAELDTSDLSAQVKQAEADVAVQEAKLEGLKAGSRPEDIAASQASLDKAKQDLANMYIGISDSSADSYAKANDAVRVQLDPFFSNSETSNPKLTYITTDSRAQADAETQRQSVSNILNAWLAQTATGEVLLQNDLSYLAAVKQLLDNVSKTLEVTPGLSSATLAAHKADLTTAINEVNTASKNLNTISQDIASQKITVSQLQAQLDLKKAGSTLPDIQAQEAQVAQSQAKVQSAKAKLQNSVITAPISGVITQFDAKVGQFASPGVVLVSIISAGSFEVDALVSEIDIGKVAFNNKASMSLDAFPGESFSGSIFYIDPAQTILEGVVGYKIKVAFSQADARLKSGLTVNLDIETRHKDGALFLPQYAIIQGDGGAFARVLQDNKIKDLPITLGLQDKNGNVEIITGLEEGEKVINIGFKQK